MLRQIDANLLLTFGIIAETQSFTHAGARLHRTQSAISIQMKRLERTLDVQLFDRSVRGLNLSREGEIVLKYARRIVELHSELITTLSDTRTSSTLKVGTSGDYAMSYLPHVFNKFSARYPGVQIECGNRDRILTSLASSEIDVAVLATSCDAGTGGTSVRSEQLVWIASDKTSLPRSDTVALAAFRNGCVYRDLMTAALDGMLEKGFVRSAMTFVECPNHDFTSADPCWTSGARPPVLAQSYRGTVDDGASRGITSSASWA